MLIKCAALNSSRWWSRQKFNH